MYLLFYIYQEFRSDLLNVIIFTRQFLLNEEFDFRQCVADSYDQKRLGKYVDLGISRGTLKDSRL